MENYIKSLYGNRLVLIQHGRQLIDLINILLLNAGFQKNLEYSQVANLLLTTIDFEDVNKQVGTLKQVTFYLVLFYCIRLIYMI